MAEKWYKDNREGKEYHTWGIFGDVIDNQPEYAIEITKEEFDEIEAARKQKKEIDELGEIVEKDGDIALSDLSKLMYYHHENFELIDLNEKDKNDDVKIEKLKIAISDNIEIPPIKAYYNSILDKWFSADGFHRICAYNDLNMDIPYTDYKHHYYIESTKDYIENYRTEKELIELGELAETTLSEEDYIAILKEVNDILKSNINSGN